MQLDSTMSNEFDKLQDELLIHILVFLRRPFTVEIAQYRPVCRRWNKLSRTKDFWKALCIKDMGGPNISPIRLYQGAKISTEARDYVIPIIKEGTKVTVDFMSYYRIRRQFVSLIQWFNSVVNSQRGKQLVQWQGGKGTDLTVQNIQAFLKIPWDKVNVKHSNAVASFLFLIIPPLLLHGHKELAQQAFNIVTTFSVDSSLLFIDYTRNCMKIHQVAREHKLPDLAFKAFEAAGKQFREFMETGLLSEPGAATVYDSIVTQIIRYGAESKPMESEDFDFKYPEAKYQVLLDDNIVVVQFAEDYAPALVSIARREFEQSNDWRVKASALSVSYALPTFTMAAALQCVAFATEVLTKKNEHAEVQHAAIVLIDTIFQQWHESVGFSVPVEQYVAIFQYFSNKLVEVPASQALLMLRIILLLGYSANASHEAIDDKMLDKFHDNLFKALLTPNVISKSVTVVADELPRLQMLGKTFGSRLSKYLKKYREVLFTIARTPKLRGDAKLSPEDVVASYVSLLCPVKEFENEAVELIQEVEKKSLGFAIRLPQFYAVCGLSCSKLPGANVDHIIKTIFGMLPTKFAEFGSSRPIVDVLREVSDKIREEQRKKQKEEEEEEYDSEDEMDISDDEYEDEPKERTDFLPYTEAQFLQAVEKSKTVPKEDVEEFQKCFQFTEPAPVNVGKQSKFVKMIDLKLVEEYEQDGVIQSFNGCQTAFETILAFLPQLGDAFLPHAQKAFHYLCGYCRSSDYLHVVNMARLRSLFKLILPYLDRDHIHHYAKILLDIISPYLSNDEKRPLDNSQAEGIMDTLDLIIESLTPVHNVAQSTFVVILDALADLLNQLPLCDLKTPIEYRACETFGTLFKKWPKNSIPAYIRSKICAWISESIREREEDTVPHLAALLMCCHIGLRFGIAFMKMSLALGPGSTLIRPHDHLDFLEDALNRFNPDGTLQGTKLPPPAKSRELIQQTVLLFHGALIYDEMDMLNCYRRYTFDQVIVKDALLSDDCAFDEDLQDLIDSVKDDNYMELIFPKGFI